MISALRTLLEKLSSSQAAGGRFNESVWAKNNKQKPTFCALHEKLTF
jgi:hypothetical protein